MMINEKQSVCWTQHLTMNLADITILSNGPVLELIEWLQGQNCLASPLRCVPCNRGMDLTVRNEDHVDGFIWFVFISFRVEFMPRIN